MPMLVISPSLPSTAEAKLIQYKDKGMPLALTLDFEKAIGSFISNEKQFSGP
ncbi:MAG TPA: hypothetical protein PKV32_05995 [Methanofastidiosum sp.]|nr:hypothetical protein [Methanofastidiosum sp.]